ncbi:DUF3656 domain-containing protein [Roseburia hominis]
MEKMVEILAPAGSAESLYAAVAAGADAVYIGGQMFGARAYAKNLTEEELLKAIDFVHLHGRKIYLTVNTLLKEREIESELFRYLQPYYEQGLDAVIVQDVGVLHFIRKYFPNLAIHASTQMTITGVDGARFMEEQGVTRVVPAREIGLEEIRKISRGTDLEIECFVHGALCYCYSGQCLLSSFIGGRSGNRGQCAQPCRLPWQLEGAGRSQYLMSLKDICTLEMIPELVEAGIDSFKIEGRMKKPEYVAAVTAMYRKYTDLYLKYREEAVGRGEDSEAAKARFRVSEADLQMLLDLYNRGGSHTGYYHTRNGREMVSLTRPNHAGIPAFRVEKRQGRSVIGTAIVDLSPQDVIELPLRRGQEKADNYTCKEKVRAGQRIQIPVFADTSVQHGDVWKRTRNAALIEEMQENYLRRKIKEKLNGKFILSVGDSAKLSVSCKDHAVTVYGDIVQEALKQPMVPERIEKQLRKTGNSEFEFEHLEIEINGAGFLPLQSLNEIRRRALEELEAEITSAFRRKMPLCEEGESGAEKVFLREEGESRAEKVFLREEGKSRTEKVFLREEGKSRTERKEQKERTGSLPGKVDASEGTRPGFTASAETMEQVEVLLEPDLIRRIYVDSAAFPQIWKQEGIDRWIRNARKYGKELYLILPYIFRENTRERFENAYGRILEADWDGVLIRNYESSFFLHRHGFTKPVVTDYNLYQCNHFAKEFWQERGAAEFTVPLELNEKEIAMLGASGGEMVVYGYLPMMVSAGCIRKTTGGCSRESGCLAILDRYQKRFLVRNVCDYCYNILYNHVPLYLADRLREVRSTGVSSMRLSFTTEDGKEVGRILKLYRQESAYPDGEFTRGHFKRGIK